MRVLSFNVNGLRSFAKKIGGSFNRYIIDILGADILCIQETKGSAGSLAEFHALEDFHTFSSFHTQRGRHGVSTMVRKSLFCSRAEEVIKGRVLKTYHGDFVLYNCYMPFFEGEPDAEDARECVIGCFERLEQNLERSRTIFCGDLNACYSMLDHYQFLREYQRLLGANSCEDDSAECVKREKWHERKEYRFTDKNELAEREHSASKNTNNGPAVTVFPTKTKASSPGPHDRVEKINPSKRELAYYFYSIAALEGYFFSTFQRRWLWRLSRIYKDTFRMHNDTLREYTCWNTYLGNRNGVNLGTRIDYIFCTEDIECTASGTMQEVMGSDHCPVYSEFCLECVAESAGNLVLRKNNLLCYFKFKK